MKFTFKSLVAVAAFVAVGASNAQGNVGFPQILLSGSGNLIFSNDALSALAASGSVLRTPFTTPNVPGVLPGAGLVNAATYSRPTGVLAMGFSSLTNSGDSVASLQSARSFVDIRRTIVNDDDTLTSRSIYLTNLDWNLSNSTIYANLYSHNRTTGDLVTFGKLAIFTATIPGIVGGTQGNFVVDGVNDHGQPVLRASGSLAGELRINADTVNIMLAGLGLSTGTDPLPMLWREANWGSASFSVTSVPEPSSYAMLGAGLLVAGLMTRRRPQAA
ncbi:MAG: hypothetical protein C0487_16980 [Leptothrix sp. (in: Bacteria)]|nr:hypothetical protein [Leptothrix sp. (in: b-proteobacteria)]